MSRFKDSRLPGTGIGGSSKPLIIGAFVVAAIATSYFAITGIEQAIRNQESSKTMMTTKTETTIETLVRTSKPNANKPQSPGTTAASASEEEEEEEEEEEVTDAVPRRKKGNTAVRVLAPGQYDGH